MNEAAGKFGSLIHFKMIIELKSYTAKTIIHLLWVKKTTFFFLSEVLITLYLRKPFVLIKLLKLDGLTKKYLNSHEGTFTYSHMDGSGCILLKKKLNKFPFVLKCIS